MLSMQLVLSNICIVYALLLSEPSRAIRVDGSRNHLDQYSMRTWTNRSFYGFRGIRYAQPPVGRLRFQAPLHYEPSWNLTSLLGLPNQSAPPCPSPYTAQPHTEDCLHLNVYTNNLTASAPVIAYIHPGGFYIFAGTPDHFGAEYLLDHDVVLVTFNYRLGFAGFASTGDGRAAGNAALHDQRLVLQWIAQNVALFGGDPRRVTLMGSSAGAMSVAVHMADRAHDASALFHRAIVMSGGLLPQLRLPPDQRELLRRQAAMLQCPQAADDFECVRAANASQLAASVYQMFEFGRDNPIFLWLPVVDGGLVSGADLLREIGRQVGVPLLTGTTADELGASAQQILNDPEQTAAWLHDFRRVAPISLHYERGTDESRRLSDRIWRHYFAAAADEGRLEFGNLSACFSDAVINFPVERLSRLVARRCPVYRYRFAYRGEYTNFPAPAARPTVVEHCDELQYLFTSKWWPSIGVADPGAPIVRRMTMMVASFAKDGTPQFDELLDWPPYDVQHQQFVNIAETPSVQRRPFDEREFWDELFPIEDDDDHE